MLAAAAIAACGTSDTESGTGSTIPLPPDDDITVATVNLLHGTFCSFESDQCRQSERLDLMFAWIREIGCPDFVALQEVSDSAIKKLEQLASSACEFPYSIQRKRSNGIDDEAVLSRYPVEAVDLVPLFGNFRTVLHVRAAHPKGPVDLFTTHLASGSDKGDGACGPDCPAECQGNDVKTKRDCQAVQLGEIVKRAHAPERPAFVTGDLNLTTSSFGYAHFVSLGWTDSQSSSGNAECNAANGLGCTSGRADEDLSGLESASATERVRIDYVFLVPNVSQCELEPQGDPDKDGTSTGLFADRPNPFDTGCGPRPAPICWPSDHAGVVIDANCR